MASVADIALNHHWFTHSLSMCIYNTVESGYNERSYNEFPAIVKSLQYT